MSKKNKLVIATSELPSISKKIVYKHLWADDLCMRTAEYPAETIIVGAEYKKSHIFYLVNGEMILDMDGEAVKILSGDMFVAEAGSQKAAYMITNCTVACFYGTQSKSIRNLVSEFTTVNYSALAGQKNNVNYIKSLKKIEAKCLD